MARTHPTIIAVLPLVLAVACTPSAPATRTVEAPEPISPVRAAPAFNFAYSSAPAQYRFSETTRLQVQVDSASREATVNTVALTTISVSSLDNSLEVITVVDSGGIPTGGPVSDAGLPPSRTVDTVRAGRHAPEESTLQCAARAASAPPATFRFFVPLPAHVTAEFSRRDTVDTTVCQRAIPVRATGTRVVTAAGTGRGGLQLLRVRTDYVLAGSGIEGQHNVKISGTGSAEGELTVDPVTGRVVHGISDLRLTMTLFASGRPAKVTQETRSRLELVR